ncbi:putative gamma-butyrobetaine hydroxylase [Nadsonia fulvescens var. elongata DSM 6958]|uniref:Trimethyllysine dioxygenase n=1 Tax=Nadsonia fulvescens var. elongata DSM 6958 TaxID=857566 RepID=A0A1E3PJJ0_9ASCO|nr:putative gamma-butyrobetaine hydroxylase [Nadsonia fulvescens var. elongata DSM 6958]
MIQTRFDKNKVYITWPDGVTSAYDNIWLRDTCQCPEDYHPLTKQRLLNTFAIPRDIQAKNVTFNDQSVLIVWPDDHESQFTVSWLRQHSYAPQLDQVKPAKTVGVQMHWDVAKLKSNLPEITFDEIMTADGSVGSSVASWTRLIHQYGCCFIDGVPFGSTDSPEDNAVGESATQALVERLAYIRPTHYGGFWAFTADLAKNDTAYTNLDLGSHTDGTYWSDPPGLQLFHLLHHSHGKNASSENINAQSELGGETRLVDGFYAAGLLRQESPQAYNVLSRVGIPAHSAGEDGVCIVPSYPRPVFEHHPVSGELVQVRWNNDDRSVMDNWGQITDANKGEVGVVEFYDAIRAWYEILTRPEVEYIVKLVPGRALIFDNWRVLHGRKAFTGSRRMCGAYINRDDYFSRYRLTNFGRDAVLNDL